MFYTTDFVSRYDFGTESPVRYIYNESVLVKNLFLDRADDTTVNVFGIITETDGRDWKKIGRKNRPAVTKRRTNTIITKRWTNPRRTRDAIVR